MKKQKAFWIIASLLFVQCAKADIRLPAIISSNMVLQQRSSVKLWGWGGPAEKVVVTTSWNNRADSTKVTALAKWEITVPTPVAGGPYTITIKANNTIVLQNVLVGEVWVCSGQSNMEMNYYWGLPQMREDIPAAANPLIRFFTIPKSTALVPQERGEGSWVSCDSNTVKAFSAVAYYFGKKLNAELHVPIGLVHASWGGTPAEVWTPATDVTGNPVLKEAAQKLTPANAWPITPGVAFNGMLAPITPYSIAGVIWYQGESNTGTATTYQPLFSTLIEAWRRQWSKVLPFYYVQLAPYNYGNKNIAALLREAQSKTLSVSHTGMVVTTDLADDTADIHPRNKRDVGFRLAYVALRDAYGQTAATGFSPQYRAMVVNKNKIILSVAGAEKGLVQKGKGATGFFVAGADKIFYPAEAKIEGGNIVVSSKQVAQPLAVRYAFSNTAVGNIFSKEGMPLAPFRTDDWPVDTSSIK